MARSFHLFVVVEICFSFIEWNHSMITFSFGKTLLTAKQRTRVSLLGKETKTLGCPLGDSRKG